MSTFLAPPAHAAFTSAPVTSATVGQQYVYDVTVDGRGKTDITAPEGLPSWLTLQPAQNGTALLGGIPTEPDSTWHVVLRAEDRKCRNLVISCPLQAFDITVSGALNSAPVVVPAGLPDRTIEVGQSVSIDVSGAFEDPDGDPLVFSVSGLPGGLSLVGSTIVGTLGGDAGSPFLITVEADDQRGGLAATTFTLTVARLAAAALSIDSLRASIAPVPTSAPFDLTAVVRNSWDRPERERGCDSRRAGQSADRHGARMHFRRGGRPHRASLQRRSDRCRWHAQIDPGRVRRTTR